MPSAGPLLIHDGRELRPLNTGRDLGYKAEELLDAAITDGERILYQAEADLLDRIALILGRPPRRGPSAARPALELCREDVAVIGHALENLGRMRARRLEELSRGA